MSVTWNYNGSSQLQATINPSTNAADYTLTTNDGNSTDATGTGNGGSLTLTITDFGGVSSGDEFYGQVFSDADGDFLDTNVFVYGTATPAGLAGVTWAYDGTTGITVDFTTTVTDDYVLQAWWYSSSAAQTTFVHFGGSAGAVTGSLTLTSTPDASSSLVAVVADTTSGFHAVTARTFTEGTADSGTPGSPTTGGTDTGTGASVGASEGDGGADPTVFSAPVRVGVAFNDTALATSPTWTYLTDTDNLVASYQIDRGRQFEFDKTDTGTATVAISDREGLLDPTNSDGPYYGLLEPLLQIKIELWNPVTLRYHTRFRGWIEDFDYDVAFAYQDQAGATKGVTRLQISCVDIFAILTAIEMQPDRSFGDTVPAGSEGNIFFDNALARDRVDQVLGNAAIPTAFFVCFSLNIYAAEAVYAPSENVLQVIQDVADAEFPTVSNVYTDRLGRLAIHGRLAKFDPDGVAAGASAGAWLFTRWHAGDGKAVAASPSTMAHIRGLSYNRGLSHVVNSALCTPDGIDDTDKTTVTGADIAGQYYSDAASIGTFGFRSWSAENLFIAAPSGDPLTTAGAGTLTGNDALEECLAYATYIVENYKEPRNRISRLTFKSMRPTDAAAAANWALLCEADISDVVEVTARGPGDSPTGYIFNAEEFFVEGVHEEAAPLTGEYAAVTLTLDLSPKAYFPIGGGAGVGVT